MDAYNPFIIHHSKIHNSILIPIFAPNFGIKFTQSVGLPESKKVYEKSK